MSPLNRAVVALGVTTILSYGGLYYALAVLANDIARDFAAPTSTIYACLSAALFVGALAGRWLGRLTDRIGARRMMTAGSVLSGLALALMAMAPDLIRFALALTLAEIVSFSVFYSTSMTALTQIAGAGARRSITHLALIGGFASTLCWPTTQWMSGFLDWRGVYLVFAALCVFIAAPLHWWALPAAPTRQLGADAAAPVMDGVYLTGPARRRALWTLSIAFSAVGMVYAAMNVLMVGAFVSLGLSATLAVGVAALMGPSQVMARIGEMAAGDRAHPLTTAAVSVLAMTLGAAALTVAAWLGPAQIAGAGLGLGLGLIVAYAVSHGISQGLNSIVLGAVPLTLFGPVGYGGLMGALGVARIGATSFAPWLAALSIEKMGMTTTFAALVGLCLIALAAFAATPRPAR